ncbi:MarR family winged helix-turn-helix transcriptional regulator [Nonomuraea fastidiosa]|jgi:DNA-binding MarR family transcriptional regulator|uniref:MarR family winged helix-turn-helix transcriptional regulator n=1 Tax=Nonomuraea TaxID=83681 RepID=UPI0032508419
MTDTPDREPSDERQGHEHGQEAVSRVWAAMQDLVLRQENRRKEVADALGMSFYRVKALRHLLSSGPMTMRELTADLATDKPYTSLMVDDLERRGYVTRSVSPEDRRSKIVTLTPAGTAAAEEAERIMARPPRSLLALGPDDLAELDRIMAKLRAPADQR